MAGELKIGEVYPPQIYLGDAQVNKIMCGGEQVWPKDIKKHELTFYDTYNGYMGWRVAYHITLKSDGTTELDGIPNVVSYSDNNAIYIRFNSSQYENARNNPSGYLSIDRDSATKSFTMKIPYIWFDKWDTTDPWIELIRKYI